MLFRDDTLEGYLDKLAKQVSDVLERGNSFLDRVRWAIWVDLSSGRVSSRRVADRVGLSVATFARRL